MKTITIHAELEERIRLNAAGLQEAYYQLPDVLHPQSTGRSETRRESPVGVPVSPHLDGRGESLPPSDAGSPSAPHQRRRFLRYPYIRAGTAMSWWTSSSSAAAHGTCAPFAKRIGN